LIDRRPAASQYQPISRFVAAWSYVGRGYLQAKWLIKAGDHIPPKRQNRDISSLSAVRWKRTSIAALRTPPVIGSRGRDESGIERCWDQLRAGKSIRPASARPARGFSNSCAATDRCAQCRRKRTQRCFQPGKRLSLYPPVRGRVCGGVRQDGRKVIGPAPFVPGQVSLHSCWLPHYCQVRDGLPLFDEQCSAFGPRGSQHATG